MVLTKALNSQTSGSRDPDHLTTPKAKFSKPLWVWAGYALRIESLAVPGCIGEERVLRLVREQRDLVGIMASGLAGVFYALGPFRCCSKVPGLALGGE